MKKIFGVLLAIIIVIGIASALLFQQLSLPISSDTSTKNFVINQGDGLATVASRLEKDGYIKNRFVFIAFAYRLGLNRKIQAGLFRLSPSLNTPQIVAKLSTGGSHDYWLKIIEGTRIEEIAQSLPPDSPIVAQEFLGLASPKEGYLFPDSYLIPQDYSVANILNVINKNFDKKISEARQYSTTNLSIPDAVTLASLLEREARTQTSKQMVSGILQNRLKAGMALQVDATIQYAHGSWAPLTKSDISIKSPYNTYLNPGLPPAPICNPGYDSLFAAFHPTASDYLYYITGNDNQMHYAKTLVQHNANIAKYLK